MFTVYYITRYTISARFSPIQVSSCNLLHTRIEKSTKDIFIKARIMSKSDRTFKPEDAKGGCDVVPEKTACVFIEYQNEFTTEGGKLHDAVKPVMESTNMLTNSVDVASKARTAGVTIIHAPISFKADHSDNPNCKLGILAGWLVFVYLHYLFVYTCLFTQIYILVRMAAFSQRAPGMQKFATP